MNLRMLNSDILEVRTKLLKGTIAIKFKTIIKIRRASTMYKGRKEGKEIENQRRKFLKTKLKKGTDF